MSLRHLLISSAAAAAAAAAGPEDAVIRSGVPWLDTDGNRIYAGGANLFLEAGVFYLVGEGKKVVSGDNSACLQVPPEQSCRRPAPATN